MFQKTFAGWRTVCLSLGRQRAASVVSASAMVFIVLGDTSVQPWIDPMGARVTASQDVEKKQQKTLKRIRYVHELADRDSVGHFVTDVI